MSEDERLVRDTWEGVSYENGRIYSLHYFANGRWILSGKDPWNTEEKAWWAAADSTRAQLKEIAEIEDEINRMQADIGLCECIDSPSEKIVYERILTRLEAALESKRQGMKGTK